MPRRVLTLLITLYKGSVCLMHFSYASIWDMQLTPHAYTVPQIIYIQQLPGKFLANPKAVLLRHYKELFLALLYTVGH